MFDIRLKIVMIGDCGVGKSCLLSQFVDKTFSGTYTKTIGVGFWKKTVDVRGQKVKLEIWEISGNEIFRDITASFYRDADGIIVVYDVTVKESLKNVEYWMKEIDKNCGYDVQRMLVGNKKDETQRKIHCDEAKTFAHQVILFTITFVVLLKFTKM